VRIVNGGLKRRRGDYGVDAPYVPLWLGAGALAQLAGSLFGMSRGWKRVALVELAGGATQLLSVGSYLYTTRCGKFAVWGELLDSFPWRGDERVLDLGCGRRGSVTDGSPARAPGQSSRRRSLEHLGPVRQ